MSYKCLTLLLSTLAFGLFVRFCYIYLFRTYLSTGELVKDFKIPTKSDKGEQKYHIFKYKPIKNFSKADKTRVIVFILLIITAIVQFTILVTNNNTKRYNLLSFNHL